VLLRDVHPMCDVITSGQVSRAKKEQPEPLEKLVPRAELTKQSQRTVPDQSVSATQETVPTFFSQISYDEKLPNINSVVQ